MTTLDALPAVEGRMAELARELVAWFESGIRPVGMFAETAFADLALPQWRAQADGREAVYQLREQGHPFQGQVRVAGLDRTTRGFLIELEERWKAEGQRWYSRELIHCMVEDGRISELHGYCTGDWDEAAQRRHAEEVSLVRS